MTDHFVRYINGMGYQVCSHKKGYVSVHDTRNEADEEKEKLNQPTSTDPTYNNIGGKK